MNTPRSFIAASVLAFVVSVPAHAQRASDGLAFGGPGFALTSLGGHRAYSIGGSGGENISDVLSVGIGGFGIVSNDIDAQGSRLQGGVGGLLFAVHTGSSLVELSAGSLLGVGDFERHSELTTSTARTISLVAQPTVSALVAVAPHLRAGVDVAWRAVAGAHLANISNRQLSGSSVMFVVQYWTF